MNILISHIPGFLIDVAIVAVDIVLVVLLFKLYMAVSAWLGYIKNHYTVRALEDTKECTDAVNQAKLLVKYGAELEAIARYIKEVLGIETPPPNKPKNWRRSR